MSVFLPLEIRWLCGQVRPYLRLHLGSFLCICMANVLGLTSPLVIKWTIDVVIPSKSYKLLIAAIILIFLCYQGKAVLSGAAHYLTVVSAQRVAFGMRLNLLRHFDRLSPEFHETNPQGLTIYLLKEPVDEIAYFGSDLLPTFLRSVITTILTLVTMLIMNGTVAVAVFPIIPIFLLVRRRFRTRLEKQADAVQDSQQNWNVFLQEHISAIISVQLLLKETRQERKAFSLLAGVLRSMEGLVRASLSLTFYTSLAIAGAIALTIGCGGAMALRGSLTVGVFVAFYSYLSQLFEPLSGTIDLYVRAKKTFSSVRKIQAALNCPSKTGMKSHLPKFPYHRPHIIEIRDLAFSYSGAQQILSIPQLTIDAGQCVAVIGENGAGKSTFAKLLARFYDGYCGLVTIGGQDIRETDLGSLRASVRFISSHDILFDTSLANNLRLGRPDATMLEIEDAADCVGLLDFTKSLKNGFRENIGPIGYKLSSGQRQRAAIARAILQRPRILILDEASAFLDSASEQNLLRKLRKALPHTTIILVSHRLSSLSEADRVLLFGAGRISANCSPTDLFKQHIGSSSTLSVMSAT